MEITKENLKALLGKKLTKDEKMAVREMADAVGVVIPDCKCPNKWHDTIVSIYRAKFKPEPVWAEDRKYHLPAGTIINWGGKKITDEEMTDALAEVMIARGFDIFTK